jgi:hypothetical protein
MANPDSFDEFTNQAAMHSGTGAAGINQPIVGSRVALSWLQPKSIYAAISCHPETSKTENVTMIEVGLLNKARFNHGMGEIWNEC